jgi:transcriptional regulator with XRE-family HTH domain
VKDPSGRGQRIACARRRGLAQAALAGLAGRPESWLSQVERGLREVDSQTVLNALAEILRIDVAELTGIELAAPRSALPGSVMMKSIDRLRSSPETTLRVLVSLVLAGRV